MKLLIDSHTHVVRVVHPCAPRLCTFSKFQYLSSTDLYKQKVILEFISSQTVCSGKLKFIYAGSNFGWLSAAWAPYFHSQGLSAYVKTSRFTALRAVASSLLRVYKRSFIDCEGYIWICCKPFFSLLYNCQPLCFWQLALSIVVEVFPQPLFLI
jgi:hypothetical protein